MGIVVYEFFIETFQVSSTDSSLYNKLAISMASDVRENGWNNWKLFPYSASGGHVSFLSIIYYFFGNNYFYVIILNSLLHALGGLLIYLVALKIFDDDPRSFVFSFGAALLFIVMPSSILNIIFVNKDVYVNIGFFLSLWLVINFFSKKIILNKYEIIILSLLSLIIFVFFKPYFLRILAFILFTILILIFVKFLPSKGRFKWIFLYLFLCLACFNLLKSSIHLDWIAGAKQVSPIHTGWISGDSNSRFVIDWDESKMIPNFVDHKFKDIASTRASFIENGRLINAKSMIDMDFLPKNWIEIICYIPRAFIISIFAPFPNTWFKNSEIKYILLYVETAIFYFLFFGFVGLIKNFRSWNHKLTIACLYSLIPLTLYSLVIPNIGTLIRLRFPFIMIVILITMFGWSSLIKSFIDNKNIKNNNKLDYEN